MIKGPDFSIRLIMEKDLDPLFPLLSNFQSVGDYLPLELCSEQALKKEYAETGFATNKMTRLLLVSSSEEILGSLWYFPSVPYFNALEIGYMMYESQNRNKGLMSQAVKHLVDYLFQAKSINRLEIRMDTRNLPSERVAQKAGFQHEGIARQAIYSRGHHYDMHFYALLRQEWEQGFSSTPTD